MASVTKFAPDITQEARQGKFQPAYGCEPQYKGIFDHLARKDAGPVIVAGPAGAGKSRFVEGLTAAGAKAGMGDPWHAFNILRLDPKLLSASLSSLETPLQEMVAFLSSNPKVVLFVDDAAGLLGLKDAPPHMKKAGEVLAPAILGGHIRSIIVLNAEDFKSLAPPPANSHLVQLSEFNRDRLLAMMSAMLPELEKRHRVPVDSSALNAVTTLYVHYAPDQHPADRAVKILDSACLRYTRKAGLASANPEMMVGTSLTALGDRVGAYDVVRTIEESTNVDIQGKVIAMKNSLAEKMMQLLPNQRDVVYHVVDSLLNHKYGFTPAFGPAGLLVLWGPPNTPKRRAVEAANQTATGSPDLLNTLDLNETSSPGALLDALTRAESKNTLSFVVLEHVENAKPEVLKTLADYVLKPASGKQQNVFLILCYDTPASGGRLQVVTHLQKAFPDGFAKRCNAVVQVIAG